MSCILLFFSRTVRDHQYNERPSREVVDEVSSSPPSNSSFVKKRSIRERSLIGYLTFLFSKVILKINTCIYTEVIVILISKYFADQDAKSPHWCFNPPKSFV